MPAPAIGHGFGYGFESGYWDYSHYDLGGSPELQPDFMSALEAAWNRNPACSGFPIYIDMQPAGSDMPYAILSQPAVDSAGNNPAPGYWDLIEFSITLFQTGSTAVIKIGEAAIAALEDMLKGKIPFANGFQMNFYRTDQRVVKQPKTGAGANIFVFSQMYTYRVWIGRSRPYANLN